VNADPVRQDERLLALADRWWLESIQDDITIHDAGILQRCASELRDCIMASGASDEMTSETDALVSAKLLDEFVAKAALEMRRRLDHGAAKFGATSWRNEPCRQALLAHIDALAARVEALAGFNIKVTRDLDEQNAAWSGIAEGVYVAPPTRIEVSTPGNYIEKAAVLAIIHGRLPGDPEDDIQGEGY
jgi:hypothetical protein